MSDSAVVEKRPLSNSTTVTVGLLLTLLGFAFWMGAQHSTLNELNTGVKKILEDHEQRIRALERKP